MSDSAFLVLAGASGHPDPGVAAVMIFLLAGLFAFRLFREAPVATAMTWLSLLVLVSGGTALGAIVVAGSSVTTFGRIAGALACLLAASAAVGGFLITRALVTGGANETPTS